MANDPKLGLVALKNVRLSFEHLFKPTASVENGPLKYRGSFLIDPSTKEGKANIKAAEAAIEAVKKEAWGDKASKIVFKDGRFDLLDGDDCISQKSGEVYDGYAGMKVVKAANPKRPKLRARDGKTDVFEDDDLLYSGAYVNAWVRFYPIKDQAKGGNGIFGSIEAVQFVKHGEKFGGGGIDDDEIEDLGDDEDSDDDI